MNFFEKYKDLDQLGIKSNTNKSSSWINEKQERVQKSSLLQKYEHFLLPYRDSEKFKMLELGAGPDGNIGASCRMWKEYFNQNASIHVADNKPSSKALESEGINVHVGDLGSHAFLVQLARNEWDFIIDDASHLWHHQILGFRQLFASVKSGGVYIMEDLCTSFGQMRETYGCGLDQKDATMFFLALTRCLCGSDSESTYVDSIYRLSAEDKLIARSIDMLAWMGNCCIVVKK